MTGTTPTRATVARSFIPAALTLAVSLPAQEPAESRNHPAPDEAVTDSAVQLGGLLGVWVRDDALSEDPIQKTESMWESPKLVPPAMSELAQSLDDRFATVAIRIEGEWVQRVNAREESLRLHLDGRTRADEFGNEGTVLIARNTLQAEMAASGWLWVDTFYRHGEKLMRMTDIQSRQFAGLRFRTVYEHARGEPPTMAPVAISTGAFAQPAVIRIVPPERRSRERLSGRVQIQALVIDPVISAVEFFLDGSRTKRVAKRPFTTRIELAHPPRKQTLEVRAYGLRGEYAGSDQIVVNQFDVPFAVRIVEILAEQTSGAGAARVAATISVPRSSTLERVEFYRSEELVATMHDFREEWGPGAARTIPVEALIGEVHPGDFVRVNARLDGNREREDAQLLDTANYRDEIDVQLVQLQVLVTDDAGNPVGGLSPEDFEIRENDKERPVGNLETQHDVPLVLGIAVDSSYSMRPVWPHLKHLTESFLDSALTPGDQAFLVDFDTTVRLVQPLTGNKALLAGRLNRLIPMGGTALNDGLLFSLLGFRGKPGRRALVMVTDGGDLHSRSRPEQSADFAERLGLPIYFIELENTVPPADKADRRTASIPQMTMAEQRSPQLGDGVLAAKKPERFASITPLTEAPEQPKKTRKRLRRISEQTGGRHFHIELIPGTEAGTAQFEQVFDQIEEDLRHQHVLTYYSDQPPGTAIEPEVRVTRRGLRLRSVVPLEAIE